MVILHGDHKNKYGWLAGSNELAKYDRGKWICPKWSDRMLVTESGILSQLFFWDLWNFVFKNIINDVVSKTNAIILVLKKLLFSLVETIYVLIDMTSPCIK